MKVTELLREAHGQELPISAALDALKKIYPDGHGEEHVDGKWKFGTFECSFELKGLKVSATIQVQTTRAYRHEKRQDESAYSFSFKRFNVDGKKPVGFHPEADSGPFIHDLKDLPAEIKQWEEHIIDGLIAQEKRQKEMLDKMNARSDGGRRPRIPTAPRQAPKKK